MVGMLSEASDSRYSFVYSFLSAWSRESPARLPPFSWGSEEPLPPVRCSAFDLQGSVEGCGIHEIVVMWARDSPHK